MSDRTLQSSVWSLSNSFSPSMKKQILSGMSLAEASNLSAAASSATDPRFCSNLPVPCFGSHPATGTDEWNNGRMTVEDIEEH